MKHFMHDSSLYLGYDESKKIMNRIKPLLI